MRYTMQQLGRRLTDSTTTSDDDEEAEEDDDDAVVASIASLARSMSMSAL